ncbi:ABSCISIC ACID-INSENSITIVE 5-like protein [Drosera capensis]
MQRRQSRTIAPINPQRLIKSDQTSHIGWTVFESRMSMPTAGVNRYGGVEVGNGTKVPAFKHQAGVSMAEGVNKRMVEEVWREIQLQENMKTKMKSSEVVVKTEREPTVCEMTLEDFLAKTGALSEPSFSPAKLMNAGSSLTPQSSSQKMCLSPALSLGVLSDTPFSGGKRDAPYAVEKSIERKMRRKIKNRESAARSRARKQAYTNELIVKVSHLEAVNMKLKREKELEKMFFTNLSEKTRYQLRRTSSASF